MGKGWAAESEIRRNRKKGIVGGTEEGLRGLTQTPNANGRGERVGWSKRGEEMKEYEVNACISTTPYYSSDVNCSHPSPVPPLHPVCPHVDI